MYIANKDGIASPLTVNLWLQLEVCHFGVQVFNIKECKIYEEKFLWLMH